MHKWVPKFQVIWRSESPLPEYILSMDELTIDQAVEICKNTGSECDLHDATGKYAGRCGPHGYREGVPNV